MGKIFDALQKAQKTKINREKKSLDHEQKQASGPESLRVLAQEAHDGLTKQTFEYKIPPISQNRLSDNPYLLLNAQDKPEVLEQYRLLRSSILTQHKLNSRPKCIMVTSPVSKEGKSTIACNLAISIALGVHERVILIDADMRRPCQDKLLNLEYKFGLADYLLRDDISFDDILYPTVIEKLFLIPSGSADVHMSTELLASNKMHDLVMETKSKYADQYVVLDTPPCSLTSDPSVLVDSADAIVLVIGNGISTQEQITDSLKVLGKEKISGIVFNCADYHLGLKKYHYQYQQYYKGR